MTDEPTGRLRDRSLADPQTEEPFDHFHAGRWLRMKLTGEHDHADGDVVRKARQFTCSECGYEVHELAPLGGQRADLKF